MTDETWTRGRNGEIQRIEDGLTWTETGRTKRVNIAGEFVTLKEYATDHGLRAWCSASPPRRAGRQGHGKSAVHPVRDAAAEGAAGETVPRPLRCPTDSHGAAWS